jgi:Holliday junction resolvase RusA-like endonuclease
MLSTLWGSRPAYTGAIELRIKLISSDRRKWDIDNRVKALQDCLELGGVVKNDTQVEILHVEREYGERSATYIEINALQ